MRRPTPRLLPLSRIAGEGGERSEPGEGLSTGTTLTLPTLRVEPLPLPRCGRGTLSPATTAPGAGRAARQPPFRFQPATARPLPPRPARSSIADAGRA